MAVNFNGLSSGLDTSAIIKATIQAQRGPITSLETRRSDYTTQVSTLGKLASKLDELKSLGKDMAKTSNVLAFTIGVGDEDVMKASANGESTAGTYALEVRRLATAEKDRSVAFASDFSQVKAGTLTIATAGDTTGPHNIEMQEGDTLDDVVDRINSSGAKVDASIVRDGTRSYLQIVSSESGHTIGGAADDAIQITESYNGAAGAELGLTQVTQAQNALVTVDGLDAEARTNKPSNIVPGIELDLKKLGTTSLSVAPDKDGTKTKLKAFVDKANEVIDLVKGATRTADGARALDPDPAIERLGTELRNMVIKAVDGVGTGSNSLARVGIVTNSTGNLEIDSTKLEAALTKDIRGIGRLFTKEDSGIAASVQSLVKRYTDTTDGLIGNRKKALNRRVDQLDSQIERMETRLTRLSTTMQKQFTAMEQAIASYQSQSSALSSLYSG
jgi:flagellar hook-associated protein 2